MRDACVVLVLGLSMACAPEKSQQILDLDQIEGIEGANALIVGIERGAERRLVVLDPQTGDGADALPVFEDLGTDQVTVTVLAYERTLSQLEIETTGAVSPSVGEGGNIPRGEQFVSTRNATSSDLGPWETSTQLPTWMAEFESETFPSCHRFGGRIIELGGREKVGGIIAQGSDALLFTYSPPTETESSTRAAILRLEGQQLRQIDMEVPGFSGLLADVAVHDAARGSGERIWLVGSRSDGGHLFVGTVEEGFIEAPVASIEGARELPTQRLLWMAALPGPNADIVYTLTASGAIQRYDEVGARWETIWIDPVPPPVCEPDNPRPAAQCGSVFMHDEVVYVLDPGGRGFMHRIEGSRVEREELAELPTGSRVVTGGSSALGPFVIAADSTRTQMFLRGEQGWTATLGSIVTQIPYAAVGFQEGFIFGGRTGYMGEVRPDGLCPLSLGYAASGLNLIRHLVVLEGRILASHGESDNANLLTEVVREAAISVMTF